MPLLSRLLACAVCFGNPNDAQSKGLFFGILALLAVLAVVLTGFARFFLTLRHRSKTLAAKTRSH